MARPLRIEIPGGRYHVTSRGCDYTTVAKAVSRFGKWGIFCIWQSAGLGSYLYIKHLLTIKCNYTYSPLVARQLRLNRAGLWYHVTARGNERKPIYRDDADRLHFVELFAGWRELFRLHLHAYVLMPNHYHLFLETTEANLSRAMQWLNTSYTVWFKSRHQRAGHVLQGRF